MYVLKPGDMLYIPPKWFHWVFSYPDELQNIAISYTIFDYVGDIYNEFSFKKPFKYLNTIKHSFFNYTFNSFKQMNPIKKTDTLISNKNILVPVKKSSLDKSHKLQNISLTLSEMENLHKTNQYNLYMGQCDIGPWEEPPYCITNSFNNPKIICNYWLALFNTDTEYIESGLHYDITHGMLIQIKGTKLVRLYPPQEYNNLYVQPTYII